MAALEKVYVFYGKPVTIGIARNSDGSELEQTVAEKLALLKISPPGPFALDLLQVEALREKYGTTELVEGKTVLNPAIPLDEDFFKECRAAATRKQYILVIDIPRPAPQDDAEARDFTREVVAAIVSPFEVLPTAAGIPTLLCTPLAERVRMPRDIAAKFPEVASPDGRRADDIYAAAAALASGSALVYSGTELAITGSIDAVVRVPFELARRMGLPGFANSVFERNVSEATLTLPKLRPDASCKMNGVIVFKGEDKANSPSALNEAITELSAKSAVWSTLFMGELPFVLCYACAGPQLQFAVQTPTEVRVLPGFLFNLDYAGHRMAAFVASVNCCRIIATLNAHNKVGATLHLFEQVKKAECEVTIDNGFVRKDVHLPCVHCALGLLGLVELYSLLSGAPNIVQLVDYSPRDDGEGNAQGHAPGKRRRLASGAESTFTLALKPLGVRRLPITEAESIQALRDVLVALRFLHSKGYAHRDLRWDNVLFNPVPAGGRWFVIDLEFAAKFGTPYSWGLGKTYLAPGVRDGGGCSAASDLYMVGSMALERAVATGSDTLFSAAEQLRIGVIPDAFVS